MGGTCTKCVSTPQLSPASSSQNVSMENNNMANPNINTTQNPKSIADFSPSITFKDTTNTNYENINVTQNEHTSGPEYNDGLCYNLPPFPQHEIVGRDAVCDEILKILKNDSDKNDKKNKQVVVTGCEGIGKTTLAAYCARKWQQKDFPNVAFLIAKDKYFFERSTKGLAVKLGIKETDRLPIGEVFQKIFELFENDPLLLILDNLEKFQVIKSMFDLPSNIYILVTSENSEFKEIFNEYPLQFLNEDDSRDIIKSILGQNFSQILSTNDEIKNLLNELCYKFDGHPLTLAHAAAHIRQSVVNAFDFGEAEIIDDRLYFKYITKYLNDFGNPKDEEFPHLFNTTNKKSVFKAIQLNVEKVIGNPTNTKSPNITAEILNILSNSWPDYIPKEMLFILFDEYEAKEALIILKKYYFITESSNDLNLIKIHRTTQSVAKNLLFDFKSCLYKALLYCIFHFNKYGNLFELNLSGINVEGIRDNVSRDEIVKIVERAFDFFETNKKHSFELLRKAGCKQLENENWPLPHKFLLALPNYNILDFTRIAEEVLKIIGNLQEKSKTGITVLHVYLTKYMSKDCIKFLIDQGLSHMEMTVDKIIPLHVVLVAYFHYFYLERNEIFEILIDSESIVHINSEGDTVLHYFAKFYLCPIFLSNKKHIHHHIFDRIIELKPNQDIPNNLGDYPIHTAVRFNNYDALLYLLPNIPGFDINKTNGQGDTAFHIAIRSPGTHSFLSDKQNNIYTAIAAHNPCMDIRNNQGETVVDIAKEHIQFIPHYILKLVQDCQYRSDLRLNKKNKKIEKTLYFNSNWIMSQPLSLRSANMLSSIVNNSSYLDTLSSLGLSSLTEPSSSSFDPMASSRLATEIVTLLDLF